MTDDKRLLQDEISGLALPFLLERLGGEVVITEAEYEELGRRYGGLRKLAVRVAYRGKDLHLTLITAPTRPPLS